MPSSLTPSMPLSITPAPEGKTARGAAHQLPAEAATTGAGPADKPMLPSGWWILPATPAGAVIWIGLLLLLF